MAQGSLGRLASLTSCDQLQRTRSVVSWRNALILLTGVSILIVVACLIFEGSLEKSTAIVVLKLPRSGSTWFTQILNEHPDIYISKEIVQAHDVGHFTLQQVEAHLARSLVQPAGKLSKSFTHIGRYVEDYVLPGKIFKKMHAVGFTLNPEHVKGINWAKVLPKDRDVKVIIFARSNIVKNVVSGIRGKMMKDDCGRANMRLGSECELPVTMGIDADTLLREAQSWQTRYAEFFHLSADPQLRRLPTMHVHYEELQAHPADITTKLDMFLLGSLSAARGRSQRKFVKRTPDQLSQVISNFPSLDADLAPHSACAEIRLQLGDINYTLFRHDDDFEKVAAATTQCMKDVHFTRVSEIGVPIRN
ncbi:hypothetical protein B484DRAFT_456132 [Ochromonadaceae sp. CCMP2298]|nr:hypothetical protein B484DRAFT_456132 [Ochromonadaceae sp. CCMP2298]|mmetsp:Transcript_518/g.1056  ORF Transcript_518/g.1056 Transcript_518/m.1056 type:complete len:362 (+) Transcript_518:63-1148(+)